MVSTEIEYLHAGNCEKREDCSRSPRTECISVESVSVIDKKKKPVPMRDRVGCMESCPRKHLEDIAK